MDVDECTSKPCGVGAKCTNLLGSYICECPSGFQGDPYVGVCEATVKPSLEHGGGCDSQSCGRNAKCQVSKEGIICSCLDGYTGDPNHNCFGETASLTF